MTDRMLGHAAAAVDRAATLAVEARSRGMQAGKIAVSHATRVAFLERLQQAYPPGTSGQLFGEVPKIAPLLRHVRSEQGRQVLDATWPSSYAPLLDSFSERYLSVPENQLALARMYLSPRPRPMVVLVHGYMSGHFVVDERLWPVSDLLAADYDVALFVLPFHGLRGPRQGRSAPQFPGTDPRMTVEGFRQSVFDLRALLRWLKAEHHPRAGLMGMSLGGYTACLTATIEPGVDFLVPVVPLACLADFSREQGYLSASPEQADVEHRLLGEVYRSVSPLARAPLLQPDRVLVVGARADRVTPISHARRLSAHFSAPLVAFPGGHLLQLGRRASFQSVFSLLARLNAR